MHQITPLARPLRRGLGLIRVSKDRDGLTSPEVQRYAIQQYADRSGIDIVDWVEGLDESGSDPQSAWWAKLDASTDRVVAGEIDVIVVWKFSRVGRRRVRWAVALDRVDTAGGSIESATEQADASPSGRLQRGMMGEFNAYQAELIGETWREAHERRVRSGLPPTGGHRFGYEQELHARSCSGECDRTKPHGIHRPDPVTGPVLRELYRLYLAGSGYARLTRYLNESGHTDGRDRWSFQGVIRMLDNGFAAGLLGHTEVVNGRRRTPPPWERRYSKGAHEPVIDDETWRAFVAHRQGTTGRRTRARSPYLLAGLARCGECGGSMHGKRTDGRFTYVCSRAATTTGIRKVSVVAWRVERYVEDWLFSFAADADAQIAAQRINTRKRQDGEFVARRAKARIAKADERLAALTIKLADDRITDDAYQAAAATIQADRDEAVAILKTAVSNPVEERAPVELPKDLGTLWATLNPEQKNQLLRPLIARVEVAPARHRGDTGDRFTVVPRWEE